MTGAGTVSGFWRAMRDSGYLHVLSANVALQLLGMLSVLLVARMLDPVHLALVRSTQAYFAVFSIVTGCGLSAPILRYCADHSLPEALRRGLMGVGLRRTVAVSSAVVALSLVLCIVRVDNGDALKTYAAYLLMLPAFSVTSLFYAYLQAGQRFAVLAKAQVAIKLLSVAAVVAATWAWGLVGFLAATLLSAYVAVPPLWKASGIAMSAAGAPRAEWPRDFNHLALLSVVGMGLTTLAASADFMLLQFTGADRHEVGVYSLATIFLAAAMMITGAFQNVVTPKFTALLSSPAEFRARLRQWSLHATLLGLASAAGCLAFAGLLERFFFGSGYAGFSALLAILLLKHVLWSAYAVAGAALVGAGLLASGTRISVATTALAFAAGYPLCVRYGVWGAAWLHVLVAGVSAILVWVAQRSALRGTLPAEA